jgi:thioredoxin-like negative regulator of GroEL
MPIWQEFAQRQGVPTVPEAFNASDLSAVAGGELGMRQVNCDNAPQLVEANNIETVPAILMMTKSGGVQVFEGQRTLERLEEFASS